MAEAQVLQPAARGTGALAWPLLVMVASGGAALGYQMVWTQQAALWLGHEGPATLAVVAAFFGGLALGAALLGRAVERSAHPARWYAGCELLMAAWSLLLAWALQPASAAVSQMLGAAPSAAWQATVTFGFTALLLLPATLAMGATLPAMARVLDGLRSGGTPLAALYAGNTLGGVAGVVLAAFWLVPQWGLSAAALVCAGLNGICALLVLARARPALATGAVPPRAPGWPLPATLVCTGFLGIGYEVVVLRVLSQVAENTVYTFALLLVVYLVGTALGAAAWARWGATWRAGREARTAVLLAALSLGCTVSGAALWMAPWWKAALGLVLPSNLGAALAAEALLATLAFGGPTLLMGALFSHLCETARGQGLPFGAALAWNTAGAALAPVLLGAGLLVASGAKAALLAVVLGYAALALLAARGTRRLALPAGAAAAALALVLAPRLVFVDMPPGSELLLYREGALGAVSVVEDPAGERVLRINNRQQEGSNTTGHADARQALLPLLLHPAPRQALFLGLGTGVTAQAAALDPAVQVLAVELLPEVVEASRLFAGVLGQAQPAAPVQTQVADARRFVRTDSRRWDVIVSDNFHPARAGSALLYTVEHFQSVRERLAPGGTFCQWLPLHQMDLPTLRSIVRSFMAVYPQGAVLLATNSLQTPVLGLWAQREPKPLAARLLQSRLRNAAPPVAPARFGLADEWALLGSFVAGPAALQQFAAGAPLNTDDHPVVSYLAPAATYAPEATPAARLLALLAQWPPDGGRGWLAGDEPGAVQRLAAYQAARRAYLAAGQGVRPLADPALMLAQVQQPLLEVLRLSPDFRPAHEPLLRLALALHTSQPEAARRLLDELARIAPALRQPQPNETLHMAQPLP